MILLKRLHLENFMAVESLDMDFEESCSVAISGANGSGKSTLFYAIAFCLLNYKKGEKFDEYIQIGEPRAKVDLEAYLYGDPIIYHVEIVRGKIQATVSRKVIFKNETYINSDYAKFMQEHEFEYLESLMFMFQGGTSILNMKPSERAATLRRIFKFEFSNIVNSFKEKQEQNKAETLRLSTLIDELRGRTFETQPLLRETLPKVVEQWQEELRSINEDLSKLENVNEDSLKTIEVSLTKIQSDINREANKQISLQSTLETLSTTIKENQQYLDDHEDLQQLQIKLDKLNTEKEEHAQSQKIARQTAAEFNETLSVYNHDYKETLKQIEISKTGVCHACGQPIQEDHIKKLENKLEDLKLQIADINNKIAQLNFDPDDEKGSQISREIRNIEQLQVKYASAISAIKTSEERLAETKQMLQYSKDFLQKYEDEREKLLTEREKLSDLTALLEKKKSLEIDARELQDRIDSSKESSIKNQERIRSNEAIKKAEEERNTRLSELSINYNNIAIDTKITKSCIDVFETQFPNFILLQACEQLESYVNEIIQKVFPYCKVSLKLFRGGVNFFYTVDEDSEEWLSVSMASGAQSQILALAYEISLARLSGIQCILLDEIDAACSPENAKIIYEFISSLDCFDQIIFITNRQESLESATRTNSNITSYRVEGGQYSPVSA